jgi:hypothetical protein
MLFAQDRDICAEHEEIYHACGSTILARASIVYDNYLDDTWGAKRLGGHHAWIKDERTKLFVDDTQYGLVAYSVHDDNHSKNIWGHNREDRLHGLGQPITPEIRQWFGLPGPP